LGRTTAAFGRVEQIEVRGRTLCLLLIKNPAGFTQVLETFLAGRESVRALFVINDLHADGRDVSWLWDVPLEVLAGKKNMVLTAGIRGADMAVRLHYAGVDALGTDSTKAGIEALLEATPEGETAYILPTYTAMLEVRKLLGNQTKLAEIPR
jgi:UDP-N-acetylmuramyl tripeptide synthase